MKVSDRHEESNKFPKYLQRKKLLDTRFVGKDLSLICKDTSLA